MKDEDLRQLQRAAAATPGDVDVQKHLTSAMIRLGRAAEVKRPDDPWLRYEWRSALIGLGLHNEAGLELGDLVRRKRPGGNASSGLWRVVSFSTTKRRVGLERNSLMKKKYDAKFVPELAGQFIFRCEDDRVNRESKRLGVLEVPVRPDLLRQLAPQKNALTTSWEDRLIRLLEQTWCLGADETETKAVLRINSRSFPVKLGKYEWPFSEAHPWWQEAIRLTGNWGQEPYGPPAWLKLMAVE